MNVLWFCKKIKEEEESQQKEGKGKIEKFLLINIYKVQMLLFFGSAQALIFLSVDVLSRSSSSS